MYYNINATEGVNEVLKYASTLAKKYNGGEISTEHLLYGLCKFSDSMSSQILSENKITADKLEVLIAQNGEMAFESDSIDLTPTAKQVFRVASEVALELHHSFVGTEHLLLAILLSEGVAVNLLVEVFSANIDKMRESVLNALKGELANGEVAHENSSRLPKNLQDMGIDLTQKAKEGKIDPIIGRNDEIDRIIEILCRKTKNNPVLIGEAGVGKSAIVEGLALRIVKGEVPSELQDKIIFSLELGGLMAGTKYRGALEEKLKETIETITKSKNIITFIDEIHTLSQAGSEKGEVSPSDMLKPYLARGELQTIGATTTDEYRKFIEKDKALERRFQPIIVNPPTVEDTIEILKGIKDSFEAFHKVKITEEAIESAVKLSDRYITDRNLPDKAIDLIDEASSKAKVNSITIPKEIVEKERELQSLENSKKEALLQENFEKAARLRDDIKNLSEEIAKIKKESMQSEDKEITAEDIASVVSSWTKIPITKLNMQEKDRLINLENILHERIIGQNEAIESVSKAIRRARVGLKDSKRPIGSFLFLGPTGVGKTETCKALAETMFNSEDAIIRLDMSEYMEAHAVSKLIGSPPGYIGHEEGGQLTEQVRRKPYSVVLFDEIEKAHPDVFNILLQILEDGRLTDSHGKTVSFRNTIIILTSNCGVEELTNNRKQLGFNASNEEEVDEENEREILMNSLKKKFRPEFLNRIDVITIFHKLSKTDLAQIASIMINNLNKRLREKNLDIKLTENAVNYLIENGSNAQYGARPLRRLIEQKIEDKIANDLLSEEIKEGNKIIVDCENNELVFTYKD